MVLSLLDLFCNTRLYLLAPAAVVVVLVLFADCCVVISLVLALFDVVNHIALVGTLLCCYVQVVNVPALDGGVTL